MITISRGLIRQLRSVLVQADIAADAGGWGPRVSINAHTDGLRIRAMSAAVVLEYREPAGNIESPEELPLFVSMEFLAAWEGDPQDSIALEASRSGEILVHWGDGDWRRTSQPCEALSEPDESFPVTPEVFAVNPPALLEAFRQAALTVGRARAGFALETIQLRGETGTLVATDSRQALWHAGFDFPWREDLLVPGSGVFSSHEWNLAEPLAVGRTEEWVAIRIARWTLWLRIDRAGSFPPVDDLLPHEDLRVSRASLSASDVAFALQQISRLSRDVGDSRSLTVEFDRQLRIRTKSQRQALTTELVLNNTICKGPPLTFLTDRDLLARAFKLGFRELQLAGPRAAAVCEGGRRRFAWALLDPQHLVPRSKQAVRIESPLDADRTGWHADVKDRLARIACASRGDTDDPVAASGVTTVTDRGDALERLEMTLRDALEQTRRMRELSPGWPFPP
ncbi:MAG TPA: hypothetical protein VGX76_24110 [Pirellulales bacterium]|jgi:hypothetical protein|nr:hypothetical protein [Pirellulales bacterium]